MLRTKAEAGDATAQFELGKAYESGNGIGANDALAAAWFRKAAEQDYARAANSLGLMYSLGRGVEKSKEQAVLWYRKAARLGNAQAMFNLGASYYNGDNINENQTRAYAWFLLADDGGDVSARDAVRRSATEMGRLATGDAILEIGRMYEKGEELPKDGAAEARWYRKSANEDVRVALKLASLLIDGRSVKQDYGEAMQVCQEATKKNYGPAEFCVGYLHQHGFGVAIDSKEAAKWYDRASNHADGPAQFALAQMYLKGEGVGVDRTEAYYLLFRAYNDHILEAKPQAHVLRQEMSKEELKSLDKKLRQIRLDPQKVYAFIDDPNPSGKFPQVFPPVTLH